MQKPTSPPDSQNHPESDLNQFPVTQVGAWATAPFDTTTQNGIASLESSMNFMVDQISDAKHLDDVSTYVAASEQREGINNTEGLRLAEITIEQLVDNLRPVLEQCDDCGLSIGLESIASHAPDAPSKAYIERVMRWADHTLGQAGQLLTKVGQRTRRALQSAQRRHAKLQSELKELPAAAIYCAAGHVNEHRKMLLMYQQSDVDQAIGLACTNWAQALKGVVLPVGEQFVNSLEIDPAQLESQMVLPSEPVMQLPGLGASVDGQMILAQLTGGWVITRHVDQRLGDVLYLRYLAREFEDRDLPDLNGAALQCGIEQVGSLLTSSEALLELLEQTNSAEQAAIKVIRVLAKGSWDYERFDAAAFEQLSGQLEQFVDRMGRWVSFLNRYADLQLQAVHAALDIYQAYNHVEKRT